MSSTMDMFDAYKEPVSNSTLEKLRQLADIQMNLTTEIEEKTKELKELTKRLAKVEEVDMPAIMDELDVDSIALGDGTEFKVEAKLYASIPEKNKTACAKWLADHEHGDLISQTITIHFNVGEGDALVEARQVLADGGITDYALKQDMNTTRVKALFKELRKEGKDIPLKLFGAYERRFVSVKRG